MAFIMKRRINDDQVRQGLVVGEVAGRDAIIFEDEIAAGSTLVKTVQTLTNAGVTNIYAGATHGVLCGQAVHRIQDSPVKSLVVTNTVNVSEEKRIEKLTVLSIAPLFAEAIRRIHTGESVGALFSQPGRSSA
jgi:ribose-phosphate pyrophosphokinase